MISAVKMTTYIETIPDPRTFRCSHRCVDVITIALLAKICGADGWEDMHEFGRSRQDWLGTFLELPAGIPSPDTFRRIISHVEPNAFLEAFLDWSKAVRSAISGLINIDGKTLRSTLREGGNPIHIVSAWCEANHMILGQLRNESKSNEITAIPELLKQLTLAEGCIITIDAAGTQKENARLIREAKADYVLAVKGNQPKLRDELENYFLQAAEAGGEYALLNEFVTEEKKHGRLELRKVYATDDLDWLPLREEWKDLRSIAKVESIRWANGERGQEIRYYISSMSADAERLGKAIRGHWGVENQCHWVLDVVFGEDQSTITEGHAPENLRTINLMAAKMLKEEKTCKKGIRAKQFKAALDNVYLHRVLSVMNF